MTLTQADQIIDRGMILLPRADVDEKSPTLYRHRVNIPKTD